MAINDSLFERSEQITVSPELKRENVRSRIALIFVRTFFIVVFIGFLIGYLQNFEVEDYKDMLLTISGVLSGPLGFIIGFYFKDTSESK